ncbi:MAG: flagellar hook protein FlgE [bacterium]
MMGSLFSSISGLKNHTTWMNVIGNNISNVNTVGYKESRITFKEAISQSMGAASGANSSENLGGINPSQMGLGSSLGSIDTVMTQGAIQTTGNSTDVAIDGKGFFIAKSGDQTLYTRAGNFTFDNSGNMVTSSGALVQGWQRQFVATPALAVPMVAVADTLNTNTPVGNIVIPQNLVLGPKATGDINITANVTDSGIFLKGNLDSMTPQNTVGGVPSVGPGALYPVAGYTASAQTSATVFDSLGNTHVITFLWTQTANTPAAAPSWNWSAYDTGSNGQLAIPNGGIAVAGEAVNVGNNLTAVTFNSDGSLASIGTWTGATAGATTPQITLALTNGALTPQTISVFMGTPNAIGPPVVVGDRTGITGDFGSGTIDAATGNYIPKQTLYTAAVDGYTEGTLTGVSIDKTGGINCQFSNNQIITMAKLGMANFANQEGLTKVGGTMFMQSANSGNAQISTAGNAGLGTTTGGSLEASNVDLSVELTNMIIAQRGFESNARIVTTSSQMLDTLVQLGR